MNLRRNNLLPVAGELTRVERVGLEHEYRLLRDGRPVDFRSVIHDLPVPGRTLDPGDPNAYRCSWGGVITCDGPEAEIATPPLRADRGFPARLAGTAATGERALAALTAGTGTLEGYSTHLSVSVPDRAAERVTRRTMTHLAPAILLLMDRSDSPGVRFRRRHERVEFCSDHLTDGHLRIASLFALGAVRAARMGRSRVPRVSFAPDRTRERSGWYVDRHAFGSDLHRRGRATILERKGGGSITAQDHLERSWEEIAEHLSDQDPRDLELAARVVRGDLPLPGEGELPGTRAMEDVPDTIFGEVLPARIRPGYVVRPVLATWDLTVFELDDARRSAVAAIPSDHLSSFLARLGDGSLDPQISAFLARGERGLVLSRRSQTGVPRLFDSMASPATMLAPERDIGLGGGVRTASAARRAKDRRMPAAPTGARRPRRGALIAGILAALLVLGGGAVALMSSGGDDEPEPVAASPTPSPTVEPSPTELPPPPPVLRAIRATFEFPVTTYRLKLRGGDPSDYTIEWDISNDCGKFVADGATAEWIHPHDGSPNACPEQPFHPAEVTVEVSGEGFSCEAVYTFGSLEGRGQPPSQCA